MRTMKYESVYDNTEISSVYSRSRSLSNETIRMWMDSIASRINKAEIKTVVDLGCGTGRFSKALAGAFSCKVIGVDPSVKMLSAAKKDVIHSEIKFIRGDSNHIPVNDLSADIMFLSQVYHHLSDINIFLREAERVIKSRGYLIIRNSTVDNMNSYLYPKFFPSATVIDLERLPARRGILNQIQNGNFSVKYSGAVIQEFAENHLEYYKKISMRSCSDLAAITDDEFTEGLEKLKKYCLSNSDKGPVNEEIDLFIFSKG